MQTTLVTGSDLIQAVVDGLRAQGEDEVEILRFLMGLRDALRRPDWCREAAEAIQTHLDEDASNQGICARCGEELKEVQYIDRHPAPFGVGTVPELRRDTYCPSCAWARRKKK